MSKITAAEYQASKPKKRNAKEEENMQIQVASYLRAQYPKVIFRSDVASGIRLTMGQAIKAKKMQSGRGYPDIFISEPAGPYHGMYLELKKSREGVFLKDGTLSKNAHIQEQAAMLKELETKGYYAAFCCGIVDAIYQINCYLNQTK